MRETGASEGARSFWRLEELLPLSLTHKLALSLTHTLSLSHTNTLSLPLSLSLSLSQRERAVKTVTWRANPMQETAIEEPRVRGVEGGGGERALTTFKTATAFKRGFCRTLKRAITFRL